MSADYVIKLISSFERLDSFQIEYDWYSQEATNAIIHLLTNCQKIKNLKCTVPLDYTRTPAGREKTQRRFIDSFNGHAKVVYNSMLPIGTSTSNSKAMVPYQIQNEVSFTIYTHHTNAYILIINSGSISEDEY